MADQINPTGGLAPGMVPMTVAPPKAPSTPVASRASEVGKGELGRQETPEAPKAEEKPTPAALESAFKDIKQSLQQISSELKYRVDEESGRVYFQVVSPSSGEVLMQVPSEEVLAAARKLRALSTQKDATGVLVDKQG